MWATDCMYICDTRKPDTRNEAFTNKLDEVRELSEIIEKCLSRGQNCAVLVEQKSDLLCKLHDMIDSIALQKAKMVKKT